MKRAFVWALLVAVALSLTLTLSGVLDGDLRDGIQWVREKADLLRAVSDQHEERALLIYSGVLFLAAVGGFPSPSLVAAAAAGVLGWPRALALALPIAALGALISFLLSRHWLAPVVARRLPEQLASLRAGVGRDGALYLASLRLLPLMPFTSVNMLVALTPLSATSFFFTTLVARLPISFIYCNAGTRLAEIRAVSDLFSPITCLSLAGLAVLPIIGKLAVERGSKADLHGV